MKKMLLLADDFTGANDSGIKIVKRGYNASISLDLQKNNESQISIVDTETRNLDPTQAYNILSNTVMKIPDLKDYVLIYKKVDSTLRGNIKQEFDAIKDFLKPNYTIFAPAHPNLGRTTINGIHYVNGKRILESEFSEDPEKPVIEDDIRYILDENTTHHDLREIRDNLIIKPGINTFDCEIYDDLLIIAEKSLELDNSVLFIGSAGLCDAIFDQLIIKKPSLAIVGSVSEENREAIDYCKSMGISIIEINLKDFVTNNYEPKLNCIIDLLKSNNDVIILTSKDRETYLESKEYLLKSNLKPDIILSKLLEEISNKILNTVDISGVFTTGGTTSIHFLNVIGATGTDLIDEIEDGVILSKIDGINKELFLVTKAGAFGNKKTIYNALNEIRRVSK